MIRLTLPRAASKNFPIQIRRLDGTIPVGKFGPGVPLSTKVFRANDSVASVATIATTWADADRAVIQITFVDSDTTGLELGTFQVITFATVADQPVPVFRGLLELQLSPSAQGYLLPDLVTTSKAMQLTPRMSDLEINRLPQFITGASAAARAYCNQVFSYHSFDEVYSAGESTQIVLRQFPIRKVKRVYCNPRAVLSITNTAPPSTYPEAYGHLLSTGDPHGGYASVGVGLYVISGGVEQPERQFLWADCPTIRSLAEAVNGLGGGWRATFDGAYGEYPTAGLRGGVEQHAACNNGRSFPLVQYVDPVPAYEVNAEAGIVRLGVSWASNSPYMWPTSPTETYDQSSAWSMGVNMYRIVYDAGYKTVTGGFPVDELPGDLSEAIAFIASTNIARAKTNPIFQSRSLDGLSYTLGPDANLFIPQRSEGVLKRYRDLHSNLSR